MPLLICKCRVEKQICILRHHLPLSTNDPVTCQSYPDLRWRLVVEAADGAMVHDAAEVRGFTRSAEAGVHTEVVAAGLAHVAVRILHDHHHHDHGHMSTLLTCVHSPR